MLTDLAQHHDIPNLRKALEYVTQFDVAIDAGAHQGIWTKEMLKQFKTVHSFEPWPKNYSKLILVNKNSYNFALGDTECTKGMRPGAQNTGQFHIVEGDTVVVKTLDGLGVENINFLKIDVEGYELHVIKGALKIIKRDKPVILTEENGLCKRYGIRPGQTGDFIKSLGYKLAAKKNKDYIWISKNQ